MAFLFGRNRQRSAQDMVRSTKELLIKLNRDDGQRAKVCRLLRQLCMLADIYRLKKSSRETFLI